MSVIYQGSTPKYLIKAKDEQGIVLDPRDAGKVTEVLILIYNAITGVVFARFYLNAAPQGATGWVQMGTSVLSPDDVRLRIVLSSTQTGAAEGNSNKIQINISVPDAEAPGGTRVIIKTGKFSEIVKAKT